MTAGPFLKSELSTIEVRHRGRSGEAIACRHGGGALDRSGRQDHLRCRSTREQQSTERRVANVVVRAGRVVEQLDLAAIEQRQALLINLGLGLVAGLVPHAVLGKLLSRPFPGIAVADDAVHAVGPQGAGKLGRNSVGVAGLVLGGGFGSYSRLYGSSRVRPGDPDWPSPAEWDGLRQRVGGRLIAVQSPLQPCREAPIGEACRTLFRELKNPYYIGDEVGLTQTTGWVDAWTLEQSAFAVAAESAADVAAAVDFAHEHNLRLVVRGGGHSYLGTSNSRDSLLVWTRRMAGIELHNAFVPAGTNAAPLPVVTVGPGAVWGHIYYAVTTKGARLVQGGGCLTGPARPAATAF
jgi:FAD/FMN-containing dehydrogenase